MRFLIFVYIICVSLGADATPTTAEVEARVVFAESVKKAAVAMKAAMPENATVNTLTSQGLELWDAIREPRDFCSPIGVEALGSVAVAMSKGIVAVNPPQASRLMDQLFKSYSVWLDTCLKSLGHQARGMEL